VNAVPAPPLHLCGIEKSFAEPSGTLRVLDGLDLTVQQSEIVVLQGPSGSGKTTLLQIAGGLLHADAGTVRLCDTDISSASEADRTAARQRHLGFVFQHFHLLDALTVEDNVALGLRLKRQPVDRARVAEVLDRLGIASKARKLPRDISGGEKQRTAFARALVGRPDLLLADEPTSQLDSHATEAITALLAEIARSWQVAVLVATHDVRLHPIANRLCRLSQGKIDA